MLILTFEQHNNVFKMFIFILLQDCQWLELDEVLNHRPEKNVDKYYIIRPFVE